MIERDEKDTVSCQRYFVVIASLRSNPENTAMLDCFVVPSRNDDARCRHCEERSNPENTTMPDYFGLQPHNDDA